MHTLPRLLLLVGLLVSGTAFSVTAYLAGMKDVEHVRARIAPPTAEGGSASGRATLPTVVLSVDPTLETPALEDTTLEVPMLEDTMLEDAVGMRTDHDTGAHLRRLADLR